MSIRAIADTVGVSPPSIYLHFEDKDHLIRSVCQLQFRKLDEQVARTTGSETDPVEKLRRRGQAYVRFGVEHPEHYRIMLMNRSQPPPTPGQEPLAAMGSFAALIDNVKECVESGAFGEGDPAQMATVLWAAVHGLTSLLISRPDFPTFSDPEAVLDRLLSVMTRGLAP